MTTLFLLMEDNLKIMVLQIVKGFKSVNERILTLSSLNFLLIFLYQSIRYQLYATGKIRTIS